MPRDRLDAEVDDLCRELLAKMPEIVRATKVQLDFWRDLAWSSTIRHAREWLTLHAASAEVAEGLASFDEKRPVDYERLRRGLAGGATDDPAATRSTCPQCGRDNPPGMRFCGFCGAGLVVDQELPSEASQGDVEIHDA